MENVADALKMAFGIFMFVICLSVALAMLGRTKDTADTILWYSDKEHYIEDWNTGEQLKDGSRIVGRDAVISALYKAQKNLTVTVRIKLKGSGTTIEYRNSGDKKIEDIIKNNLQSKQDSIFTEKVEEVTVAGVYKIAEDGTKITVSTEANLNPQRVYITYTEQ